MVDERDRERPRRKTTKKKKRRAASAADPIERPRRRRRAPDPPPSSQWTTAHIVIALVVGLGVGGIGGYYYGGQGEGAQTAGKDKGQAPAASQVAGGAVQPQQPQAKTPPKRPQEQTGPVYVALAAHSPRKGPANAKVTILEFSDFQ